MRTRRMMAESRRTLSPSRTSVALARTVDGRTCGRTRDALRTAANSNTAETNGSHPRQDQPQTDEADRHKVERAQQGRRAVYATCAPACGDPSHQEQGHCQLQHERCPQREPDHHRPPRRPPDRSSGESMPAARRRTGGISCGSVRDILSLTQRDRPNREFLRNRARDRGSCELRARPWTPHACRRVLPRGPRRLPRWRIADSRLDASDHQRAGSSTRHSAVRLVHAMRLTHVGSRATGNTVLSASHSPNNVSRGCTRSFRVTLHLRQGSRTKPWDGSLSCEGRGE